MKSHPTFVLMKAVIVLGKVSPEGRSTIQIERWCSLEGYLLHAIGLLNYISISGSTAKALFSVKI